eukprot:TRINITY_DN29370_c1_g1_i2.p1 TRINITY_DN29370_c1_g1~~TRINITY_DN29370_c1_g1_i2.p1  ORF type:complete len:2068 (+),score=611.52 TRINITY_DN29370_c1_g1_i2:450-6206(+)
MKEHCDVLLVTSKGGAQWIRMSQKDTIPRTGVRIGLNEFVGRNYSEIGTIKANKENLMINFLGEEELLDAELLIIPVEADEESVHTEQEDEYQRRLEKEEQLRQEADDSDQEYDKQERQAAAITTLTDKDFQDTLGFDWKALRPKMLDFSQPKYRLESLGTMTGPESQRGILNYYLNRSQIQHIDVSDNRLHDIDVISEPHGFGSLSVLMARRNLIHMVDLALSRLLELNLAHNHLSLMPNLSACPVLEVLILSHNHIKGPIDKIVSLKMLKRLDLAYNDFDWFPSELGRAVKLLANLRRMNWLRLYNNPFVADFKEYQVFVVLRLKTITRLDDVDITPTLRADIKELQVFTMDCYEDDFKKRRKARLARSGQAADTVLESYPRFKIIIDRLEETIETTDCLRQDVRTCMENGRLFAAAVAKKDIGYNVEQVFWSGLDEKHPQAVVSHFLELAVGLMERHDSVRCEVIELLGYLTPAVANKLGEQCMATLGRLMTCNEECKEEAMHGIRHVVVPTILSFAEQDMSSPHSTAMVYGLVELMKVKAISLDVASNMQETIALLVKWLNETNQIQDSTLIVKLVAYATCYEPNLMKAQSLALAQKLILALDNRSISENENMLGLWLDVLRLSRNLVQHGPDEIVDEYKTQQIHVKVIARCKTIVAAGELMTNMKEATAMSGLMQFLQVLLARRVEVLQECCSAYHLIDLLISIMKQHYIDPLVLASTCRVLTICLQDDNTHRQFGSGVVEELGKLVPLLDFLGGKKYPDLYLRSLRHMYFDKHGKAPEEEDDDNIYEKVRNAVASDTCEVAVDALLAIIELIAYYAADDPNDDEAIEDQRDLVNQALNAAKREECLLKLLVMDDDDVKVEVMKCIRQVPLDQIEAEEMGLIIKRLAMTRNIGEGRMEETLAIVVNQIERLAGSVDTAGKTFRKNFAEVAIVEAYEILYRNAQRDTFGKDEEEQKLKLSVAVVSLFCTCSRFDDLRDILRNAHINETAPSILKWEEERHSPEVEDVSLERCWIGRSLVVMQDCLNGEDALDHEKKVGYRVLARIADILEGRSDGLRSHRSAGPSLQEVAARESKMWDWRELDRIARYLDDKEWEEREQEAEAFINSGGLETCVKFLSSYKMEDRLPKYKDLYKEAGFKISEIQAETEKVREKKESEEQVLKDRDEPDDAPMEEEEDLDEYLKKPGMDCLMIAVQGCEDTAESEAHGLFAQKPSAFEYNEEIFVDMAKGWINPAYRITATLRMFNALLVVPPDTPGCRIETINELRNQDIPIKLLALMEDTSLLACHTAAKYLRVMALALDLREAGVNLKAPKLEMIAVLSEYTRKIAEGLLASLRLSRDSGLGEREQVLCVEMARFFSTILGAMPHFNHHANLTKAANSQTEWAAMRGAQDQGITAAVNWLVPPVIIRLLIAMICYDLQMDLGGGIKGQIGHGFVQQTYGKRGLKEHATECLSKLLIRVEEHKYDVLEVFTVSDVFLRMSVRPSYLAELLTTLNLGAYTTFIEAFLAMNSDNMFERVVACGIAEQAKAGVAGTGQSNMICLVCCTNRKVYILKPNEDHPPYAGKSHTPGWHPSWEAAFPREPEIIDEREYKEIKRLYRCYGTQMLAIEWKEEQASGPLAAKAPPVPTAGLAAAAKPNYNNFMFHRALDCEEVLQCLHKNSGAMFEVQDEDDVLPRRAPIVNDPTIRNQVLEKAADAKVLAASIALPGLSQSPADLLQGAREPRLYVLTMKGLLEFSINMGAWALPTEEADIYFDADDFVHAANAGTMASTASPGGAGGAAAGGEAAVAGAESLELSAEAEAERMRAHVDRLKLDVTRKADDSKAAAGAAHGMGVTLANSSVANFVSEKSSLSEVTFETSEDATLALKFGGQNVNIQFYDDSGRELWRKALAYYLAHGGSSWERNLEGHAEKKT